MNDIVDRLRETAECADYVVDRETAAEAVAEITRLTAEVERLRAALEPFASLAYRYDPVEADDDDWVWDQSALPTISDLRRARAALGGDA